MKAKYFVLMAMPIVFFSCARRVRTIPYQANNVVNSGPAASAEACIQKLETIQKGSIDKVIINKEDRNTTSEKVVVKRKMIGDSITTKDTSRKELKKKIKAEQKANKEMDPRLSRGLLMTIFGGIATTLGIVFMAYAPTGLFVFAFGIVFLVGLVTLIMYWANPKPKM